MVYRVKLIRDIAKYHKTTTCYEKKNLKHSHKTTIATAMPCLAAAIE